MEIDEKVFWLELGGSCLMKKRFFIKTIMMLVANFVFSYTSFKILKGGYSDVSL